MSQFIYLNTRNKDEGINTDAIFHVTNGQLSGDRSLTLEGIQFPNQIQPISIARRNYLLYVDIEGDAVYTSGIIQAAFYNDQTFQAAVEDALNASGAPGTFTVTVENGFMTITNDSENWRIVNGAASAHVEIGYDIENLDYYTAAVPSTLPFHMDISGTKYVDIVSRMGGLSWNSTGTYSVLTRVPITAAYGSVEFYNPPFRHSIQTSGSVSEIRLGLRDDRGFIVDLPNVCDISYSFVLENVR